MDEDHVVVQKHMMKKLPAVRLRQVHIAYGYVRMKPVLRVVNCQVIKTNIPKTLTKHCSSSANLNYERALTTLRCCISNTRLYDTWS